MRLQVKMKILGQIGKMILNWICPPTCPICHRETECAHTFCPECYARLVFITRPCCTRCGRPFEYTPLDSPVCGACLQKKPAFDRARSVLIYDDFSKQPILALKHGDKTELAPLFVRLLAQADPAIFHDIDMIIPVPLHWTRRLKRTYNQAGLLAQGLGRIKQIPFEPCLLKRVRRTPSQGHLHHRQREKNVRGAFAVVRPEKIRGRRILVVDDVMTTGATLNACARTLKRAGAREVRALTVYRVLK